MAKKNCKEFKYHGDRKLFSFIKTKITTDFISFYSFEFCVSIVGLYETFSFHNMIMSIYVYITRKIIYCHILNELKHAKVVCKIIELKP